MTIRGIFRLVGKAWSADHKVSLPTPFEAMTRRRRWSIGRDMLLADRPTGLATFAGLL